MAEVKKSDFIYFQNEFLQDLKKLDNKLTERITQITTSFQNNKMLMDQKFEVYSNKLSELVVSQESNDIYNKIKNEFDSFKRQINQKDVSNSNKIYLLERNLSDACFKYDNIFSSSLSVPGLIGHGCKYLNLKNFLETTDKKITELLNSVNKNNIDLKKYKDKLESLIGQFKLQVDNNQNKYMNFCNEKIADSKKEVDEQFKLIDEKMDRLRLENGKHSFELINKTEELTTNINRINNITNEVDEKLKEEIEKFKKYNKDLMKVFDSQKDEYKLIKVRFTELSEFIKDVRFARNLKNYNKGNVDFDAISFMKKARKLGKKMNFDKPQVVTKEEEDKYIINNNINISYEGEKSNDNNILEIIDKDDDKDKDKDEDKDKNKDKEEENKNKDKEEVNKNIKSDENNDTNNDEKKIQANKSDKKKFNIKLNIVDSNANSKKSSIKITNNTDNNNTLMSAKSRNYKNSLNSEKKENDKRKYEFLRTESSSYSITNQKDKKFFIRTQSQFYFISKIHQEPEFKNTMLQKTQENFRTKNNNLIVKKIERSLYNREEGGSAREERKFRNILEKNEKIDLKELLKIFTNLNKDNNSNYLVHMKIIKYLNNKIIELNDRMNELKSYHKVTLERVNKKIQLCIDLNNSTLLKFKKEKLFKKDYPNIYNNYEINIPFINKNNNSSNNNNNKCLTDREKSKVKIKGLENSSSLYIQDFDKKFTSGKLLSIIEPYLIKKFKDN